MKNPDLEKLLELSFILNIQEYPGCDIKMTKEEKKEYIILKKKIEERLRITKEMISNYHL